MKTELTEIRKHIIIVTSNVDNNIKEKSAIYLRKIYKKYGTIEVSQIQNIIK
tara:strand:+ start:152 stop:307 length:156 start_codon:yes stop_codon:yes gene_type:complete